MLTKHQVTKILSLDFKRHLFILTGIFLFHGLSLLKSWEHWIEEKMMSKAQQFKNAMCVYAAELIGSTRVLGFQT